MNYQDEVMYNLPKYLPKLPKVLVDIIVKYYYVSAERRCYLCGTDFEWDAFSNDHLDSKGKSFIMGMSPDECEGCEFEDNERIEGKTCSMCFLRMPEDSPHPYICSFECVNDYTKFQIEIAVLKNLFCICGQPAEKHLTPEGKKICLGS